MVLVPTPPQGLQAAGGNGQISLSWQIPSSNGGSPIVSYTIFRGASPGSEVYLATAGNTTAYTDGSLAAGQIYYYTVSATNGAGQGLQSNEAFATVSGGGSPGNGSSGGNNNSTNNNNTNNTTGNNVAGYVMPSFVASVVLGSLLVQVMVRKKVKHARTADRGV